MKPTSKPADTTPEAAWVQVQAYRSMSGAERVRLSFEMGRAVRDKVCAAIRERHPEYSEEQVKYAEFRLHLGDELFEKAYPAVNSPKCPDCESLRAMYS